MAEQPASKKKVATAYALWLEEKRPAIVKEIGTSNVIAVSAAAFEQWKSVPEEAKADFEKRAQELKERALAEAPKQVDENAAVGADAVGAAAAKPGDAAPEAALKKKSSEDDIPLVAAPKPAAPKPAVQKPASQKPAVAKSDKPKLEKKKSSKDNALGEGEPPVKKANTQRPKKEATNEKLSVKWRTEVKKAVEEYIEKHSKDWSLSLMVEELSESKGWESDEPLRMAVKMAIKDMGFTGFSAACPKRVAAWY